MGPKLPKRTVGLVIAAYRAAEVVDQTLAAVAAQTRLPDRVVLVDDASPDDTTMRAKRWHDVLPLEVICKTTNGGVARARNDAIARLDTDLVAIVDGDDLLLPDHVDLLARLHRVHGGIVSARARFWNPGLAPRPYQRRVRGLVPPRHGQLARLIQRNFVFVASMVEREALNRVGGFSEGDRSQDTTADWDLWLRLVAAGDRVTLAPYETVLYRIQAGSMADDASHLLRCEIGQLERSRAFLGPRFDRAVDRAIANRHAELSVIECAAVRSPANRLALAKLASGRAGGDVRNRARAAAFATAPALTGRFLRTRGVW